MYQTRKEVIKAANTSDKAAILSSIRHWKELSTAPPRDLVNHEPYLTSKECALCERFYLIIYSDWNILSCRDCPLDKIGEGCLNNSDSIYKNAEDEFYCVDDASSKPELYAAVKRFRRRAKKMVKVLESLL